MGTLVSILRIIAIVYSVYILGDGNRRMDSGWDTSCAMDADMVIPCTSPHSD